jgi:hypothetical protein
MTKSVEDNFCLVLCSVDEFLSQYADEWMDRILHTSGWQLDTSLFDAIQKHILENNIDTQIRFALYELSDLPEQIKYPRIRHCDFELLYDLAFDQDSLEHSGCLFTGSYDEGDQDSVSISRLEEIQLITNWWTTNQVQIMDIFISLGGAIIEAASSKNAELLS